MNRPVVLRVLHRPLLVHRLPEHVEHAPQHALAYRHRYRLACVLRVHAAPQAVGRGHSHRADHVVPRSCCTSRVNSVVSPSASMETVTALKISGRSSAGT